MSFTTILLIAMIALSLWSIGNIARATSVCRREPKGTVRYFFWEMNGMWNIVNLAIAIASLGLLFMKSSTIANSQTWQLVMALIVLINVVFDIVYIALGLWLKNRKNSPRQNGYGRSLVIQGTFLLVFDAVLSQILIWQAMTTFS